MKFARILVDTFYQSISAYCLNVTEIEQYDPSYGKTWMFFPDDKGYPQVIYLNDNDISQKFSLAHDNPDNKITMWLYNK